MKIEERVNGIESGVKELDLKMAVVYEWYKDSKKFFWTIIVGLLLSVATNAFVTANNNHELESKMDSVIKAIEKNKK